MTPNFELQVRPRISKSSFLLHFSLRRDVPEILFQGNFILRSGVLVVIVGCAGLVTENLSISEGFSKT